MRGVVELSRPIPVLIILQADTRLQNNAGKMAFYPFHHRSFSLILILFHDDTGICT